MEQRKVQFLGPFSEVFHLKEEESGTAMINLCLFAGSGIPETPTQLYFTPMLFGVERSPSKECGKANVCFDWELFCDMSQGLEWGLKWTITSRSM